MSLVLRKLPQETWCTAMIKQADKWGLVAEVQEFYDIYRKNGATEKQAAFDALMEWDCLDYEEKKK